MAALFHSEPPIGVRAAPPLALLALTLVRVGLFVGSFFFFSFLLIFFFIIFFFVFLFATRKSKNCFFLVFFLVFLFVCFFHFLF